MLAILDAIDNQQIQNIDKVLVISNRSDSVGLQIAKTNNRVSTEIIPKRKLTKTEFDDILTETLRSYDVCPTNGLICLAGFMQILGPEIVNMYQNRIMNIHPSLLPSFKGLHAQKQAVDAGVKVSGCTVHFVDNYVDHGPIILQKCVPVFDSDNEILLSDRILIEEHKIYAEAINLFVNNRLKIKDNKVSLN